MRSVGQGHGTELVKVEAITVIQAVLSLAYVFLYIRE